MLSVYIILGGVILAALVFGLPTIIEDYRKERANKKL
jgi:hypothetical protein